MKKNSNKGVFKIRNGKMLFSRCGPMSGQIQKNRKKRVTPERKGIWAFPYPLFEMFYAYHQLNRYLPKKFRSRDSKILGLPSDMPDFSNMDDDGNPIKILTPEEELLVEAQAEEYWDKKQKIEKEYKKKFLKIKKIWHGGTIYSRIPPNNQIYSEDNWYMYKNPSAFIKIAKKNSISKLGNNYITKVGFSGVGKENYWFGSCDYFECFLPMT